MREYKRFIEKLSKKVLITKTIEMDGIILIYFKYNVQDYLLDINKENVYLSCKGDNDKYEEEINIVISDIKEYIKTTNKSLIPRDLNIENISIDAFLSYIEQ
jgi:hypothetical protein